MVPLGVLSSHSLSLGPQCPLVLPAHVLALVSLCAFATLYWYLVQD